MDFPECETRVQLNHPLTKVNFRYHRFGRSFFSFMVQVASELGESTLSSAVTVGDTKIVRAFEGGRHDCGWYTGPRPLPSSDVERLLTVKGDKAQLIPLDVKCNLPRSSAGGEISLKWQFTALQWKYCQAALLFSIKHPTILALVPRVYIEGAHGIFTQQGDKEKPIASSIGIRPLWVLHPFPAVPPGLAPFVLPRKGLGKALANMQAYSEGHTDSW